MFLLRPFAGYIAAGSDTASGSFTVQSSQRLLKKKEEHHDFDSVILGTEGLEINLKPHVSILKTFFGVIDRFFITLSKSANIAVITLTTQIVPNNQCYRMSSSFRI